MKDALIQKTVRVKTGRFKKPEDATGQKVERKGLGSFSILYTNSKDLSSSIFHYHLPASTGVDTPEYVTIFLTNLSATIKKNFLETNKKDKTHFLH